MALAKDIGIDLGTANTLVYLRGRGIVLKEPSVVAVNKSTGQVLKVGNEAKELIGRTPDDVIAVRPLKDGVIADFEETQAMLKYFVKKVYRGSFLKPRIVVCIPYGVTEVEKRAVEEAVIQAGGKAAYLIEEPLAAAIGAGLSVNEPRGCMVADIGGGTSEVAVISYGGIVVSRSLRIAGDEFDEDIVNYVKKEHNVIIGERTAENIKIEMASAHESEDSGEMEVKGRDAASGLPRTIVLTGKEVRFAILKSVFAIVDAIKMTIEQTPPELVADIMYSGITLTGGGALIKGLDKLIAEETGVPVYVADSAFDCVALGTGASLSSLDNASKGSRTSIKSRKWK